MRRGPSPREPFPSSFSSSPRLLTLLDYRLIPLYGSTRPALLYACSTLCLPTRPSLPLTFTPCAPTLSLVQLHTCLRQLRAFSSRFPRDPSPYTCFACTQQTYRELSSRLHKRALSTRRCPDPALCFAHTLSLSAARHGAHYRRCASKVAQAPPDAARSQHAAVLFFSRDG